VGVLDYGAEIEGRKVHYLADTHVVILNSVHWLTDERPKEIRNVLLKFL
jgi:hypothetical protein